MLDENRGRWACLRISVDDDNDDDRHWNGIYFRLWCE